MAGTCSCLLEQPTTHWQGQGTLSPAPAANTKGPSLNERISRHETMALPPPRVTHAWIEVMLEILVIHINYIANYFDLYQSSWRYSSTVL